MKFNRTSPFALALSLAAAAVVFGADTTKKKPAPAKPVPTKPAAEPKEEKPAAEPKSAEGKPAGESAPKSAKVDDVVATVDGDAIKRSEVVAVIKDMLAQRGLPLDGLPEEQIAGMVPQMLERVVRERLVTKASASIKVTEADVNAELETIRKSNNITDADITKQLAAAGKTMDSLKGDIRKGLQQQKWFDSELKDKVKDATEADAKEFYDKNPQHFTQPPTMRASHILFMLKPESSPEEVTAALDKAKKAIVRAKTEDFAKLAGELSEEPGAKERGGDLNFFPRQGAMVEPFAAAAFGLKKGEITPEPVRTDFGYHVIKATDLKEATAQPFAEAKVQITEHLTTQKKKAAAGELVQGLRDKSKIEIKLPQEPKPPVAPEAPKGAAAPQPPAAKGKPIEAVTPPVSVPAEPAPAKPEPAKPAPAKK